MPVSLEEQAERLEQLAYIISEGLAAIMQVDGWLQKAELFEQMPDEIQHGLSSALQRGAAAYGSLKAAQYQ
jgi:hypothetical protein